VQGLVARGRQQFSEGAQSFVTNKGTQISNRVHLLIGLGLVQNLTPRHPNTRPLPNQCARWVLVFALALALALTQQSRVLRLQDMMSR
jgi:hypothetical protein